MKEPDIRPPSQERGRRSQPLEKALEDDLGTGWISSFVIRWVVDSDDRTGLSGCFGGLLHGSSNSKGASSKVATSPAPSTEDSTVLPLDPLQLHREVSPRSMASSLDIDNFDIEVEDSMNVPWFKEDGKTFISAFFVEKDVSSDDACYVPGAVSYRDSGESSYPPRTYDRRVSTNIWQTTLAGAMLEAGLRLVSLQANMKLIAMMFLTEPYAEVPAYLKLLCAGFYLLGIVAWFILGVRTAWSYRDFIHPDNQIGELMAFGSAALLSMFAMPNDVALLAMHMLPAKHGGLLQEQQCVAGNTRWPVHTIAHHSKFDHDYTNWSGSKVQLPLFVFVDVGCSCVIVYISVLSGILNFAVLLTISSTFLYALYRGYVWIVRWHLRRPLLQMWLQMSTDHRLSAPKRQNVASKYIAEGGDAKLMEKKLKDLERDLPVQQRRNTELIEFVVGKNRESTRKEASRVAGQIMGALSRDKDNDG